MADITIKNIPPTIYERIRMRAMEHHQSINDEILAILIRELIPPIDVKETLKRAKEIRKLTAQYRVTHEEINQWKKEGRE
jgi:plasmid stability protein